MFGTACGKGTDISLRVPPMRASSSSGMVTGHASTHLPQALHTSSSMNLARFKTRHEEHLSTIALRGTFLDQSDVTRLLNLSIPGLDEMMALL